VRGRAKPRTAQPARRGLPPPAGLQSAAVDLREESVVLETDRYRITGALTLPEEGFRSRLSDYVNQRDREFLTLSDATIETLDGSAQPRSEEFLMIGRRHVRLITSAAGASA
jgi:hypothetical protein